jgi:hypothetical protein
VCPASRTAKRRPHSSYAAGGPFARLILASRPGRPHTRTQPSLNPGRLCYPGGGVKEAPRAPRAPCAQRAPREGGWATTATVPAEGQQLYVTERVSAQISLRLRRSLSLRLRLRLKAQQREPRTGGGPTLPRPALKHKTLDSWLSAVTPHQSPTTFAPDDFARARPPSPRKSQLWVEPCAVNSGVNYLIGCVQHRCREGRMASSKRAPAAGPSPLTTARNGAILHSGSFCIQQHTRTSPYRSSARTG